MADLKTLIEREAESVRPRPPAFDEIERQAERRRGRRRIGGGIVGVAAALVAITVAMAVVVPGRPGHTPSGGTEGNYVFVVHGIGVPYGAMRFPQPSTAGIDATVSWGGDEFPGVHQCTVRAFAEDGSVVGEQSFRVMSMTRSVRTWNHVEVVAPPTGAEILCDPERLDVGEPYSYEFRDAHVDATRTIHAAAVWTGPAAPGVVTCLVRVLAPSGDTLAAHGGSVYVAQPPGEIGPIRLGPGEVLDDSFYSGDPSAFDVRFDCRPFDGSPPPSAPTVHATPPEPLGISVVVLNATSTDGLATATAERLDRLGYRIVETSNVAGPRATTTVYFASEAERDHAVALAALVDPEAGVEPLPADDPAFPTGPDADLVVVLGDDASGSG